MGDPLPPRVTSTNNLKDCDTYEGLGGSKAIPSNLLNYAYCGCCTSTKHFQSYVQQILSAGYISHNIPCLHVTSLLKRCDMSQHNLVSAQDHAEDMVAPLTANIYITCHAALNTL